VVGVDVPDGEQGFKSPTIPLQGSFLLSLHTYPDPHDEAGR